MLVNGKDKILYIYPAAFKCYFYPKSYRPIWPTTIIDFSDKDILADIYHIVVHLWACYSRVQEK